MNFKQFLIEWSFTTPDIRKYLEKKGYKHLGKGVDQSAYLEPSTGKILKIFGTSEKNIGDKFSKDHLMFKTWVNYCDAHKDNEFLPKYDGWESFEYDNKKYLQIRMERLQKLPKELGQFLSTFGYHANAMAGGAPKSHYKWFQDMLNGKGEEGNSFEIDNDEMDKLIVLLGKEGVTKLWKTLVELGKIRAKHNYGWDLHGGNLMHRNDGIPVIVDPWIVN